MGVCKSLTAERERHEQHRGRSSASQLPLEAFLVSLVSGFIDAVLCLMIDEVVAHRERHTEIAASASGSSVLNLQSIFEICCTAQRGDLMSTAIPETSGTSSSMPLIPIND